MSVLDFSPYCFFLDLLLVTFNIVRVGQFIELCSSLLLLFCHMLLWFTVTRLSDNDDDDNVFR